MTTDEKTKTDVVSEEKKPPSQEHLNDIEKSYNHRRQSCEAGSGGSAGIIDAGRKWKQAGKLSQKVSKIMASETHTLTSHESNPVSVQSL